jgi:CRISPR-associated endonuclease Csn1
MEKVLGLDLGTESIGWAIVEKTENGKALFKQGAVVFPKGVKEEKGIESSKSADRRNYRSVRRLKFRRKLRKYETLKVLIEHNMCPLTLEELDKWVKYKKNEPKVYPSSKNFQEWLKTNEKENYNPYFLRANAATKKISPMELGRALYHIAQRRGYKSNKLTDTDESTGVVQTDIDSLSQKMGDKTLGQYFAEIYKQNKGKDKERIRTHYTSREHHYVKEFEHICKVQNLDESIIEELRKAIFYQRPLKSQKGLVGKCIFEKSKSRAPISHPDFEEYRKLCFINSIRIKNQNMRPLCKEEYEKIDDLFYRKSKPHFDFEEIKKKITNSKLDYEFNFHDKTNVSGCPVSASLKDLFGDDWRTINIPYTREKDNKQSYIDMHDIWHVLFTFDDNEKCKEFAKKRLHLDDERAKKFSEIHLKQGYASLSLAAIRKILPFLRKGLVYSDAAFMAQIPHLIGEKYSRNEETINQVMEKIKSILHEANENRLAWYKSPSIKNESQTAIEMIEDYLQKEFNVSQDKLMKLYHPSQSSTLSDVFKPSNGFLGTPRSDSVKNPMAMRTLFELRKLLNCLIKNGDIDSETKINVELARELNDRNKRIAYQRYQYDREKIRKDCAEYLKKEYGEDFVTPANIEKYELWKEQDGICMYTGKSICIEKLFGEFPEYDIEHTLPRSLSQDNSMMNKTLCDVNYNRNIKKQLLPIQLSNYEEIECRLEKWKRKAEDLGNQYQKYRNSAKAANTKEQKDLCLQKAWHIKFHLDDNRGKYWRFTVNEIPDGFANRQLVDTGIITKFARAYLKSYFTSVYTMNGIATATFRKLWGLQDWGEDKKRTNHSHHMIDAAVLASINKWELDQLNTWYKVEDEQKKSNKFALPWKTFREDVLAAADEILVKHADNGDALKQTKKKLRTRGKINHPIGDNKKAIYQQGDSVRGSLHKDTIYGAIKIDGEIKYVTRKMLNAENFSKIEDLNSIGDEQVKKIIISQIEEYLKEGLKFKEAIGKSFWMNKEKGIIIRHVRCFANSVKNPIYLKKIREDVPEDKEYKNQVYVTNDENYALAIYREGKKHGYRILNLLEAAKKKKNDEELFPESVEFEKKGLLKRIHILKTGMMVLLYEKDEDDLKSLSNKNIQERLYKISGLSINTIEYAMITLINCNEARPSDKLKSEIIFGEFKNNHPNGSKRAMRHNQFRALVEGEDFELAQDGRLKFLC